MATLFCNSRQPAGLKWGCLSRTGLCPPLHPTRVCTRCYPPGSDPWNQTPVTAELCGQGDSWAKRFWEAACVLVSLLLLLLSRFSHVRLCATHRQQYTKLPRPWDSPGKNTGLGCHFLLQCIKVERENESEVAQSCLTAAYQAPPPMGFSRQEYWSGVAIAFSVGVGRCKLLHFEWINNKILLYCTRNYI